MENCCRTCLRDKRPNSMKLLSTKWNDTLLSFADMLMDIVILNKEITSDETSFRICSSCELNLISAYNFKIVCQNTEKILAERLTKTIIDLPPIEEIKCETIIKDASNNLDENKKDLVNQYGEQPLKIKISEKRKIKSTPKTTKNRDDDIKEKTVKSNLSNLSLNNVINQGKTELNSSDMSNAENKRLKYISKLERKRLNRKPSVYCKKCDMKFEEEKFYRRHCRLTHREISKKTEKLNLSTNNENTTVKKPENRRPSLFCKKCNVRFEAEKLYRKHCEETHLQSLSCTICGKLYLETRMKQHMITHSTERAHLCTICGRNFLSKSYLHEHLRIHADDKRYKCNYCDETFVHWNSRKFHIINVHTKEKEYECYICHKLFARRGQMSLHVKYHLGDLCHPCTLCDKRFVHEYALTRHKLTHFNKRKKKNSKKNITENSTNVIEPLAGVYS